MAQLNWSAAALADVVSLYRFLAVRNPSAASRAIKAIRECTQVVASHPGVGRPVDHMDNEFRDWLIGFGDSGHVVRYHSDGETVIVIAVRYQKEAGY